MSEITPPAVAGLPRPTAPETLATPNCRLCGAPLHSTLVDLGKSPLCESFLTQSQLNQGELFFPLHVRVCDSCFLVQLEQFVSSDEIFRDYAYFSSYSRSWLEHARIYTGEMIERLGLGPDSFVVELASNDGYLLQYFVNAEIPCLGIEPARNVARDAEKRGVETITEFFGLELARELRERGIRADLLIGKNVLAQVPDLNDFLAGMNHLLASTGVVTLEFPHLKRLLEGNQFDTIYHEHFSYFSFRSAEEALSRHGLRVFDVQELSTHGGSLRVFACHQDDGTHPELPAVGALRTLEEEDGVSSLGYYSTFTESVQKVKRDLLRFLIDARDQGREVVGYGAPGKGNTLLNYCGIRSDLLTFTVDRNPHKQGLFLPGTQIPIFHPDRIREVRPDFVLILPWNLRDEIADQLIGIREWGGRFVVPIPGVEVF